LSRHKFSLVRKSKSYLTDVTRSRSQTTFVVEESKNIVQRIRGINGLVYWQQSLSMKLNKYLTTINPFIPQIRCTAVLKERGDEAA